MAENTRETTTSLAAEGAADLPRDVMNSFSDAVYIIDVRDYRVLACNDAFLRKHGFSVEEVLGRPCYELTHKLDHPCTDVFDICPLKETLETGKHSRAEHIHFLADGERVYEEISTSPIFEESGEILKVVSVARDITARKRAEEEAKRATEFSRTVMESIRDAVSVVDVKDYRVLGFNAAFLKKVGFSASEVLNRTCYELTHRCSEPCSGPNDLCPLDQTVHTGTHSTTEHVHFSEDGGKVFAEVSTSPIFDENGRVVRVVHVARNITERKHMEEALFESENKFRSLAEKALVGVYIIQEGVFRYLNPKFNEIFGYEMDEMIDRMGPKDLTLPEDLPTVEENLRRRVEGEIDSIHYEFRGLTKEQDLIDLEVYGTRAVFEGRPAVIGTLLDITARKRTERELVEKTRELEMLALFDELTGLYNRRGFLALADKQLKTAERMKTDALLVFADLDGLKEINDCLGHQDGDAALKDAADLLKDSFRGSDIIARLGGDEFAILALSSVEEGKKVIASRMEEKLFRLNDAENRKYRLSLSVGIVPFDPGAPCSVEQLLEHADEMMYQHKKAKKKACTVNPAKL